jgi:ribose transport system substrate-binding protein
VSKFLLPASIIVGLTIALTSPASAKDKQGRWVIAMSQCNLNEPWRVQMNADIKKAAEKYKDKLVVIYKDAQADSLRQRAHVEEFLIAGVDLLIISPFEAVPLTEPIAKAFEKVPVIVLDRKVMGDKFTQFIGADNKKIGKYAGQWIAETLGGKGKVVELKGMMTSVPAQDRNSGFREGIKGSKVEVLFDVDYSWMEENARKEMESALSRFPKIDLVYAHNDPGAHGAYLAAKAAGREKEMQFVGIDALPHEGVAYVKQGILAASFQYPTGGDVAIEQALKILAGEKVPKEITLGSRIFTAKNVDAGGKEL